MFFVRLISSQWSIGEIIGNNKDPFVLLACLAVVFIVLSMFHVASLKPSDGAVVFAGLLTFAIVWWQGSLIKEQMQLSAIIELDREWNSSEMLAKRRRAWTDQNLPNKHTIEGALEFLEKVSTFEKEGVISCSLIWDTFGWYVWRYYHYSKGVIAELQEEWAPGHADLTLYENLKALNDKLLGLEVARRRLSDRSVKEELDKTKDKFVSAERRLNS